MRTLAVTLIVLVAAAADAGLPRLDPAGEFVRQALEVTSYKRADADLNGDGNPEVIIYATDQDSCGSGGCDLFVLSPHGTSYRLVMEASVAQLPIRLLATSTRG